MSAAASVTADARLDADVFPQPVFAHRGAAKQIAGGDRGGPVRYVGEDVKGPRPAGGRGADQGFVIVERAQDLDAGQIANALQHGTGGLPDGTDLGRRQIEKILQHGAAEQGAEFLRG
jgi:hypothetical protein